MSALIAQTLLHLFTSEKEDEAYRFLHQQYYKSLLKFAIAIVKETEPAEEIVSDTLYKVWVKLKANLEISYLKVYLFTAVKNNACRYLSNQKRNHAKADIYNSSLAIEKNDPESLLINKQLYNLIIIAVNNLPPRCKMIFEMVRMEGLRNKDVAKKLDISVNTIDTQLATAVKRINKVISSS